MSKKGKFIVFDSELLLANLRIPKGFDINTLPLKNGMIGTLPLDENGEPDPFEIFTTNKPLNK